MIGGGVYGGGGQRLARWRGGGGRGCEARRVGTRFRGWEARGAVGSIMTALLLVACWCWD